MYFVLMVSLATLCCPVISILSFFLLLINQFKLCPLRWRCCNSYKFPLRSYSLHLTFSSPVVTIFHPFQQSINLQFVLIGFYSISVEASFTSLNSKSVVLCNSEVLFSLRYEPNPYISFGRPSASN